MKAALANLPPNRLRNILALYNLGLHVCLLVYDYLHPGVWLNWDRAGQRLNAVEAIIAATGDRGSFVAALLEEGIVGDYAFQAPFFWLAGPIGVNLAQIALSTLAVAAVFEIAYTISRHSGFAAASTVLYLHLPHSLAYPHLLASEAFYIPLIILSFYFMYRAISGSERHSNLLFAGLLLGLASIIRPITIPWAIVAWIVVALQHRRMPDAAWSLFTATSLVPVMLWLGFQFIFSGKITLGESSHDMQHNLSNRVERISRTLPAADRAAITQRFLREINEDGVLIEREVLTAGEYLLFTLNYPGAFLEHLGRDAAVFAGKTGATRLMFDYFELLPSDSVDEIQNNWRRQWEREGFAAGALGTVRAHPWLVFSTFVFSAVCLVIVCVGLTAGSFSLLKGASDKGPDARGVLWMTVLFPFYVFGTSQVVNAIQSRHRAPAEFIIAILFCFAVLSWMNRRAEAGEKITSSQ